MIYNFLKLALLLS